MRSAGGDSASSSLDRSWFGSDLVRIGLGSDRTSGDPSYLVVAGERPCASGARVWPHAAPAEHTFTGGQGTMRLPGLVNRDRLSRHPAGRSDDPYPECGAPDLCGTPARVLRRDRCFLRPPLFVPNAGDGGGSAARLAKTRHASPASCGCCGLTQPPGFRSGRHDRFGQSYPHGPHDSSIRPGRTPSVRTPPPRRRTLQAARYPTRRAFVRPPTVLHDTMPRFPVVPPNPATRGALT